MKKQINILFDQEDLDKLNLINTVEFKNQIKMPDLIRFIVRQYNTKETK